MTVRLLKRAPLQQKGTFAEPGTLITHQDEDWLVRLGIAEKVLDQPDAPPAAAEASTDEAPPIAATVDEESNDANESEGSGDASTPGDDRRASHDAG